MTEQIDQLVHEEKWYPFNKLKKNIVYYMNNKSCSYSEQMNCFSL